MTSLFLSASGSTLASGSSRGLVRLWDMRGQGEREGGGPPSLYITHNLTLYHTPRLIRLWDMRDQTHTSPRREAQGGGPGGGDRHGHRAGDGTHGQRIAHAGERGMQGTPHSLSHSKCHSASHSLVTLIFLLHAMIDNTAVCRCVISQSHSISLKSHSLSHSYR